MQSSLSILYTSIIYSVYSIYSAYANTMQPSCQAPDLAAVLFSILFLFILNTKWGIVDYNEIKEVDFSIQEINKRKNA